MLGAAILTRLDPWMSTRHARRIRGVLGGLYDEMEAVPGTRSLGTVVNLAMAELLGGSFRNSGHYYAYVPENRPGERLGMIVFLHGNAGNHKVMAWAWKPFADRYKVAIVCPTFGFGFWGEGGVEAVERSREHALDTLPIDPGLVWLGGISDGGKGVTRTAAEHPERYRGLIYLSPTMLPDEVGSRPFLDGWKGRPALIFQGTTTTTSSGATSIPRPIRCDAAVSTSLTGPIPARIISSSSHVVPRSSKRSLPGSMFTFIVNAANEPLLGRPWRRQGDPPRPGLLATAVAQSESPREMTHSDKI